MSFQQGLSGLNATNKSLEIIGNNIANANTYGSKVARAEFSDVYALSRTGVVSNAIGIGVNTGSVAQQFTQGNIATTENPMDLAINGAGFFQLSDGESPIAYSRNGQFKLDREGFIVNNGGYKLMGYVADDNGNILPGAAAPLHMPTSGIAPKATTRVNLELNFDARQQVTVPANLPAIDFQDPKTFNNATSQSYYDAKGQALAVTYYFQKSAVDTWNVFATANGVSVAGTTADPQPITTITYPPDGRAPTSPVGNFTLDIPGSTSALGVETLPIPGLLMNFDGTTQYGSPYNVTNLTQDGFAAGLLNSLTVEGDGRIMARYSNGESKSAGQIELANFRNPQGLQSMGDNVWGITSTAGEPVLGTPGEGNLGVLQAGALEESNIDLPGQLVNMITAQRAYQANAQTIKTMDQVLQTLVNLR